MESLSVEWSDLFASIDFFSWSKIFFKLFVQDFFCWFLHVCIIFLGSAFIDTETCSWVCQKTVSGPYPNRHIDLLPPQVCGSLWWGYQFFYFACHHQLIDGFQVNHTKLFKFAVVMISVRPRVKKSNWVNPSKLFCEWSKGFQQNSSEFYCLSFVNLFSFENNIRPKGN